MIHALSYREINLGGVVLAGLVGGYLMAIAGLWAGRVPGLTAVDVADYGRRYIASDRPSAWMVGFASHLANSVLLTLVWAMAFQPWLPVPRWVSALLFGELVGILFSGALVAPLAGLGVFGRKTKNHRFALTSLLLHALWGLTVGLLYVPR